jgi:hypothetical protein
LQSVQAGRGLGDCRHPNPFSDEATFEQAVEVTEVREPICPDLMSPA